MNKEFLQSEEWLTLQAATGKEVLPFVAEGFLANGIIHTVPFAGHYLYIPRGPRSDNAKYQMLNIKKDIEHLMEQAQKKKVKWLRIEPETEAMLHEIQKVLPSAVVKAPHDVQPRVILKMSIEPTEETLLAEMKPKTRYNIRLAEKRGVRVFETNDRKYQEAFLGLVAQTSGRKGIRSHPRSYYQYFFQTLPHDQCRLFVAEYEGRVIASNIVIVYGDTATYLHGGSSDLHRDVMAPYLLQWEQIRAAKRSGCKYYDFGGIQNTEETSSASFGSDWSGITKFKSGFAPKTLPTIFPGTYDIPLDASAYRMYRSVRKIRFLVVQWKDRLFL